MRTMRSRTVASSANGWPAFTPREATDCGGRFAAASPLSTRDVMSRIVITVALGLLVFGSAALAQPTSGLEDMILDAMPRPVRCDRTSEPFFFCRHDTSGQHL